MTAGGAGSDATTTKEKEEPYLLGYRALHGMVPGAVDRAGNPQYER